MESISAYIPCFNNAATIKAAIESIRGQRQLVEEIFVIDDGSSDGSRQIVQQMGVRVISHERTLGRGAARARAMQEASHDLVLCLDGNKTLCANFVQDARVWFEQKQVAAVYGRILQPVPKNVVERWRGRHLFKTDLKPTLVPAALLITAGAMVRKSAVMQVGNFHSALRHSEDRDLGQRLLDAGFEVWCDPKIWVTSITDNNLWQVLERYWRWNAGCDEAVSWRVYLKQIAYSIKVMAVQDLKAGDPAGIAISVLAPHYQFWRSWLRRK